MRKPIFIVLFLFIISHLSAQPRIYDSDSLYGHSNLFQEEAKYWQAHYDLFEDSAPIELTLKSDLHQLIQKKIFR